MSSQEPGQLALVRSAVRRARPKKPDPAAAHLPVARVAVDVGLAHLDRPFDYAVPEPMSADAQPGVRVRVRFAGRLVDGFVLGRTAGSEHEGRLARLAKVVSPEPVLAPDVASLARSVADRYAGSMSDVLRLALPPRHARVEAEAVGPPPELPPIPAPAPGEWSRYVAGPAFLAALGRRADARAVWGALPGPDWPAALATAVAAALAAGRGALVVVPDARDVARVDAALAAALGADAHAALVAVLTADLGPAERYRRWLAVRRGSRRVVVGTRAAAFAPVRDLGLAVVWDDGDDLHAEPRAPYPHVREVVAMRAHAAGSALLVGGFARTAEGARLVATGWARALVAERTVVRAAAPRVQAAGNDADLALDPAARAARLPSVAWQAAHDGLRRGPVLVQVPRRGYLPLLACARCRAPARCAHCAGPLGLASGHAVGSCRWCGRPAGGWTCPVCGGERFRAVVVGAGRTAEELGRAFPAVPVRRSGGDGVLAEVSDEPAVVVATPGAEPVAAGGYAAALLLDGWALLSRADLRAAEETLRRWLAAAALVRPSAEGGRVVVLADAALPVVQALVRWDPATFAERELVERTALGFPPAARLVSLTGAPDGVDDLLRELHPPASAEVLGPVPTDEPGVVRALVRVEGADASGLARAVHAAQGVRSARKAPEPVRVRVDPLEIG